MNDPLFDLAGKFAAGKLTRDEFLDACDLQRTAVNSAGAIDVDRQSRCGFSEVIYGEGKSAEQISTLLQSLSEAGQPGLVTRIDNEKADRVRQTHPAALYSLSASTLRLGDNPQIKCSTAIVSAGTSDRAVAEEARETMRWMGLEPYFASDVGVAGPARLLKHLPALRRAKAVVVVAGMEGALASVVGGHLSAPVIAVPTSVGYGASWGGLAALLAMLNSCAANVCVANIDAGFKGGFMAGLIARQCETEDSHPPESPRTA